MNNYNVAFTVTVSEERGANLDGYQRCRQRNLPKVSKTISYRAKRRVATGVAVSTERVKIEVTTGYSVEKRHGF